MWSGPLCLRRSKSHTATSGAQRRVRRSACYVKFNSVVGLPIFSRRDLPVQLDNSRSEPSKKLLSSTIAGG
jgi:hypothetical protein